MYMDTKRYRKQIKKIAEDVADMILSLDDNEIKDASYLTTTDYSITFRYPVSLDLQQEAVEEAEIRLAEMTSGNNWAYTWAEWDDGFYFTVGATSE